MQDAHELLGRELGPNHRYHIQASIAKGGFGAVYRAWDSNLRRNVALKVLIPALLHDATFVERFRREALAVARLQHRHILQIYDSGEDADGLVYLVMPLIEGGTLKDRLQKAGRQPWAPQDALHLARQLLPAMDYAHAQHVIHRDVKPANVLLDGDWAWLADFGIATIAHGEATAYEGTLTGGGAIGTPEYMAPEQVVPNPARPLDGRADHYAFGVVLYELLTGRVPFKGETTWETCYQVLHAPLPLPRDLNPNIPEAVEAVVVRALARERDNRYASGGDLVAALVEAVGPSAGSRVVAPPGPAPGERTTPSQDRPVKVPDDSVAQSPRIETVPSGARPRGPHWPELVTRVVRAARLDDDVYDEVKQDSQATRTAALVVSVSAVASAIGFAVLLLSAKSGVALISAAVGGLAGAYAGWGLWAFLTWAIGTGIFHGAAKPGEVLRASGFAQSPGVLGLLSAVPTVGILFYLALGVWAFLTGVAALRQTLRIGRGQATGTALLAGIPCLAVQGSVGLGVSSLATQAIGALTRG